MRATNRELQQQHVWYIDHLLYHPHWLHQLLKLDGQLMSNSSWCPKNKKRRRRSKRPKKRKEQKKNEKRKGGKKRERSKMENLKSTRSSSEHEMGLEMLPNLVSRSFWKFSKCGRNMIVRIQKARTGNWDVQNPICKTTKPNNWSCKRMYCKKYYHTASEKIVTKHRAK
jgi:hypothetical protein